MPTPQEYIKQAEKWGRQRQSREGLWNALQWGWQAGMQARQLQMQKDAVEREKEINALNAMANVLNIRAKAGAPPESLNRDITALVNKMNTIYGTNIPIYDLDITGQEKKWSTEMSQIALDIKDEIIKNRVQLDVRVNKVISKSPRKREAILKDAERYQQTFQALQTQEKQRIDTLIKIQKDYDIVGQTPEGTPQGIGLLPPGEMRGGETPTRGARATGLQPSGLLNIAGQQWKPKPQLSFEEKEQIKAKYRAKPAGPVGANKETIINNYINKFKTPPGAMGAIKIRRPEERRNRLKGVFRAMELEKKNPTTKLNESDRWRVIETVMTDLGIEIGLQHSVRAAMMAEGVTVDQLIAVIERYQTKKVK